MDMIVVYDIAHPRRLNRVVKVVQDYGVRVQKSVFEAAVDRARYKEMKRRILEEIEPDDDAVKYFPLCVKCAGTVEIIGQGVLVGQSEPFEVI